MDVVTILLVFVVVLLIVSYLYTTWQYGTLEKLGIPVVKPFFCFGSYPKVTSYYYHQEDIDNYKKFGKVWGFYEGRTPNVVIGDPEVVKQVFIKDSNKFINRRYFPQKENDTNDTLDLARDEKWKVLRTALSPGFSTGKLKSMSILIQECVDALILHLKDVAKEGAEVDIKKKMSGLTMDVIATCGFGTKINSLRDTDDPFVKSAGELLQSIASPIILLPFMFPFITKFFDIFPVKPAKILSGMIRDVMQKRPDGEQRGDFLDIIKSLWKQVDTEDFKRVGITESNVVAQGVIFLLAGYDTTATTLTLLSYHLAKNEDIQERLLEEVQDVIKSNDGKLQYEILSKLTYTEACINETLRMHPPVVRLEREASEDWEFQGYRLKKGHLLIIPTYALHYDPDYFPDPYTFNPDRFLPENKDNIVPYTHLPFGTGPRHCIGQRFALEEIKLAMAKLIQEFKFTTTPRTKINMKPGYEFLISFDPVYLKVEKRDS